MQSTPPPAQYRKKMLRMTALLLTIWFLVTFVVGYYARDLDFTFFGWPFSFWIGAQGAVVVYVGITWFYARYMNKLDKEYGMTGDD